jgi:hypothetical protein
VDDLLEETSPSFRWVWGFDVVSEQLSAEPHNRPSNSEKKIVTKSLSKTRYLKNFKEFLWLQFRSWNFGISQW